MRVYPSLLAEENAEILEYSVTTSTTRIILKNAQTCIDT